MNIGKNFSISFRTSLRKFYWRPKRLTMDHAPAIYRWLWFNFSWDPRVRDKPTVRIYRPTHDWAGLGYRHWMVAGRHDGKPVSGCHSTFIGALLAYGWWRLYYLFRR